MKPGSILKFRPLVAAAVTAAFFVPLGILGGPALGKSVASVAQYEYSGSSQYQYKVVICHHTHSKKHPLVQISVGAPAVKAHIRHRDSLGPCPTASPSAPKRGGEGKSDDSHGKSDDSHGKSNDSRGKSDDSHGNGNAKGHNK